jgi:hypothetical protein
MVLQFDSEALAAEEIQQVTRPDRQSGAEGRTLR